MTTIIQGNKELLKEYKYFKCSTCGWIGKANKDEYKYCGDQCEGDEWFVKCLCCGRRAYSVQNGKDIMAIKAKEEELYEDIFKCGVGR